MNEPEQPENPSVLLFPSRASESAASSSNVNAALLGNYLRWLELVRHRSPATIASYRYVLNAYAEWLAHRAATTATRQEMELFIQRPRPRTTGPASAATQRREVSTLRAFYQWLYEEGYTTAHLARGLHGPKATDRDPKPIADDDWKKLWLAEWPPNIRVLLGLAYFGGLRRAELWELEVGQLTLNDGDLGVNSFTRKGGGEKHFRLTPVLDVYERSDVLNGLLVHRSLLLDAVTQTKVHNDPESFLVSWRDTCSMVESMNKRWTNWSQTVGISHTTPHMARHSAATNLARAGVPPHLIMALMNHSSLDVTMRYVRAVGADLDEWLRHAQPR